MANALSGTITNPRLATQDYKTLLLATLGGALEFYDFIIFVFFANVIGDLFSHLEVLSGSGNFKPLALLQLVTWRDR
jgi:hypothetical protein